MSNKNIEMLPFDDRNLPENRMSNDRMNELDERFAPFIEEAKQKLKTEMQQKEVISSNSKS